jgi:hypothetical protein
VAQIAVGQGILGVEVDGPAILLNRLVAPARRQQGEAEVVVRLGILGFEGDGLPVLTDRVIQPALLVQDDAEVGVGLELFILQPFDFRLFQDLGAACDQATR